MFKKMLVITLLALLMISCSLTDSLTKTSEPEVIIVTATPQSVPVMNTVPAATTPPETEPVEVTQLITDTISDPVAANLTLLAGPFTGTLVREDDYLVPWYCAGVEVEDFAARVTFTSLPAFDKNANSFALFFRQTGDGDQYRLIVYSTGWEFYNVRNMDHVLVNSGTLNMNWNIHGDNTFEVFAVGNTGYFYLNGYRIYTLNLKDRDYPGNVCVVSSVYTSDTYGVVTEFQDFEVWQLDPQ